MTSDPFGVLIKQYATDQSFDILRLQKMLSFFSKSKKLIIPYANATMLRPSVVCRL